MPHSGGGGSAGGGFHSGSSSSRMSSSGMRGNNMPPRRRSTVFFPGAYTYLYYRNRRPYYYYSNYDLREDRRNSRVSIVILAIVALLFGLLSFNLVKKGTSDDAYVIKGNDSYSIIIKDSNNLLEDKESLKIGLEQVQKQSGTVLSVMAVTKDEWSSRYDSLEDYAYELYVNNFTDEDHYLIVYSVVADNTDIYAFETIVGDNYSSYIDYDVEDNFSRQISRNLESGENITTAILDATNYLSSAVQEGVKEDRSSAKVIGIVLGVIALISIIGAVFKFIDTNKQSEYVRVDKDNEQGMNCPYCGERLLTNKLSKCPFCGKNLIN